MAARSNKGIGREARSKTARLSGGPGTSRPKARSQRRDDGSGQAAIRVVAQDHAHRRLADLSSRTPSGGGPAPTPDRSKHPAKGFSKGIDKPSPVTEARMSAATSGNCLAGGS